jgi:tRNA G18 (ribose-2'-O)-methylase SpoU
MRKLTHPEIVERQLGSKKQPKVPCAVVLNNIRSLYNVGSIFRTSDGAGIEKLWICGITGHPPSNQISKTALGAENEVLWEHGRDVVSVIRDLKGQGYQIVLLEQMAESVPYADFKPQFPVCLVLGNEIGGVSEEIISLCDAAIEIEMAGLKNSLNVSVAFGVIAYYIRQCFLVK